jgi:hypothetical protein
VSQLRALISRSGGRCGCGCAAMADGGCSALAANMRRADACLVRKRGRQMQRSHKAVDEERGRKGLDDETDSTNVEGEVG